MITVYSNITASLNQNSIPPARMSQWNIEDISRISDTREGYAEIRAIYKRGQRRSWYVTVTALTNVGLPLNLNRI